MKVDSGDSEAIRDADAVLERELLVQRYVDGILDPEARTAFETRMRRDPSLGAAVDDLRGVSRMFKAAAQELPPRPSADFQARVLARAASAADESEAAATVGPVIEIPELLRWARRALIAAAVIAVVSLVVLSGALRRADDGRLQASEAEVQKSMAALDAQMRAAATPPHAEGR